VKLPDVKKVSALKCFDYRSVILLLLSVKEKFRRQQLLLVESGFLCALCVPLWSSALNVSKDLEITQRTQRYAESTEKNSKTATARLCSTLP
jgi:hypothetical protein